MRDIAGMLTVRRAEDPGLSLPPTMKTNGSRFLSEFSDFAWRGEFAADETQGEAGGESGGHLYVDRGLTTCLHDKNSPAFRDTYVSAGKARPQIPASLRGDVHHP